MMVGHMFGENSSFGSLENFNQTSFLTIQFLWSLIRDALMIVPTL